MSQRAQSFVLEPGRQPRVTPTPTFALKEGRPFLSFAVQGGDAQDQNLLQFFLDMVEFGMNVQQATEAANFNSYQIRASFGEHEIQPSGLLLNEQMLALGARRSGEDGLQAELWEADVRADQRDLLQSRA